MNVPKLFLGKIVLSVVLLQSSCCVWGIDWNSWYQYASRGVTSLVGNVSQIARVFLRAGLHINNGLEQVGSKYGSERLSAAEWGEQKKAGFRNDLNSAQELIKRGENSDEEEKLQKEMNSYLYSLKQCLDRHYESDYNIRMASCKRYNDYVYDFIDGIKRNDNTYPGGGCFTSIADLDVVIEGVLERVQWLNDVKHNTDPDVAALILNDLKTSYGILTLLRDQNEEFVVKKNLVAEKYKSLALKRGIREARGRAGQQEKKDDKKRVRFSDITTPSSPLN